MKETNSKQVDTHECMLVYVCLCWCVYVTPLLVLGEKTLVYHLFPYSFVSQEVYGYAYTVHGIHSHK